MYSYEDRIRAVELYIKLANASDPPSVSWENSLKGWYNEYQQKLDLPAAMRAGSPSFRRSKKAAAIEHYLTEDRCIAATMKALGYPGRGTLTAWVREAAPEARRAVVGSVGRRRYSGKLMQAGVMELCTREESARAVADNWRVPANAVQLEEPLLGREVPASMKRTNPSPPSQERDELERQVESLRREVKQFRLEQDLLNMS